LKKSLLALNSSAAQKKYSARKLAEAKESLRKRVQELEGLLTAIDLAEKPRKK